MSAVDSARRPVFILALLLAAALAPAAEPTLVRLNDTVGDTIDRAERDSFHLFPNTAGFQHAVILDLSGLEFYAKVAHTVGDSLTTVYYRILPGDLERIRFLLDYPDFVSQQQKSDSTVVPSLASFWQLIEGHPLQDTAGEPFTSHAQPAPPTVENRYCYAIDGTTCGSFVGGFIGSQAGIK